MAPPGSRNQPIEPKTVPARNKPGRHPPQHESQQSYPETIGPCLIPSCRGNQPNTGGRIGNPIPAGSGNPSNTAFRNPVSPRGRRARFRRPVGGRGADGLLRCRTKIPAKPPHPNRANDDIQGQTDGKWQPCPKSTDHDLRRWKPGSNLEDAYGAGRLV